MYWLACFSVCILSAAYYIFPVLFTQIAEAGTKGEMSYLDAPDECIAVPGDERSPS